MGRVTSCGSDQLLPPPLVELIWDRRKFRKKDQRESLARVWVSGRFVRKCSVASLAAYSFLQLNKAQWERDVVHRF